MLNTIMFSINCVWAAAAHLIYGCFLSTLMIGVRGIEPIIASFNLLNFVLHKGSFLVGSKTRDILKSHVYRNVFLFAFYFARKVKFDS